MGGDAPGLFEGLNVFLEELNPFLAYVNYMQEPLAVFISSGAATLNGRYEGVSGEGHLLPQYGINNSRSLGAATTRPNYERGNAYGAPNYLNRAFLFGGVESFGDCRNSGGDGPNGQLEDRAAGRRARCGDRDAAVLRRSRRRSTAAACSRACAAARTI